MGVIPFNDILVWLDCNWPSLFLIKSEITIFTYTTRLLKYLSRKMDPSQVRYRKTGKVNIQQNNEEMRINQ